MLTCRSCLEEKSDDLFHPSRLDRCKACLAQKQRDYRLTRPKGYWQNKDKRYALKKRYGLSLERFCEMIAEQEGICAICQKEPESSVERHRILHVDHCHESGKVRALLCNACNRALGYMREDPALIRRAAAYLEHHRDKG